ncbi:MAG: biotin--[acetyl-CoA-carboxylase] ligase [Prolixibacteraceae bacterium]|nr:biotin--[acetyl-CoA-carboxylase] ligase [Prolixibacteraceae bacterium]
MAEIIGNTIIKFDRVDSTNNYATAHLAKDQWKEGTVVVSKEQTHGRGQINNRWESEPGKNILMSIFLQPSFLPVSRQFMISKLITLGITAVLDELINDVFIKWPNDVYVENRKIAGILIENAIMGSTLAQSVAGIGLNVNQQTFSETLPNPVSLFNVLNVETPAEALLIRLLNSINRYYEMLRAGSFAAIDWAYEKKLYRFGIQADYADSKGRFSARLMGVHTDGRLKLETSDGEIRMYQFKEVAFVI